MGGRALKTVKTVRLTKEDFSSLSIEIKDKLKDVFTCMDIPLYYRAKESFGDLDLVVRLDSEKEYDIRSIIETIFEPNEIFHNDNAWSFDYKSFQIDLITAKYDEYQTMLHYFHYNDMGNFIGRLAQKLGLKYGSKGLWYEHYFKRMNIGTITISKDQRAIYDFLGLDYERFLKGFDTMEEIFEFITNSKYFDADSFQLKNLNKINRDRNLKRKSYMSLLDWIEANASTKSYTSLIDYSEEIEQFFPNANLTLETRRLEYEYTRKLYIKAKFNGKIIMDRYGIQPAKINDYMTLFKTSFPSNEEYSSFIIHHTIDNICRLFEMVCKIKPI